MIFYKPQVNGIDAVSNVSTSNVFTPDKKPILTKVQEMINASKLNAKNGIAVESDYVQIGFNQTAINGIGNSIITLLDGVTIADYNSFMIKEDTNSSKSESNGKISLFSDGVLMVHMDDATFNFDAGEIHIYAKYNNGVSEIRATELAHTVVEEHKRVGFNPLVERVTILENKTSNVKDANGTGDELSITINEDTKIVKCWVKFNDNNFKSTSYFEFLIENHEVGAYYDPMNVIAVKNHTAAVSQFSVYRSDNTHLKLFNLNNLNSGLAVSVKYMEVK